MSNAKRQPLSLSVRFKIFHRDGFACSYCGRKPPEVCLEVDHVNPVAAGGTNDDFNLTTSCFDCNRGKGANVLDAIPTSVADQAEMAAERALQLRKMVEAIAAEREALEDQAWMVAEVLQPGASEGYNANRLRSIERFIEKLGFAQTHEAARIAAGRVRSASVARFKYFCGICWNKLEEQSNG